MLVRWALDRRPGILIDPSHGGCVFLDAAVAELQANQAIEPGSLVFGTDIDASTSDAVDKLVTSGVPARNLLGTDFLSLRPYRDLPAADAIVGNPPYVRHHWISAESRATAQRAMQASHVKLDGKANLWSYFLIHSISFLKPGGRLAMILPTAILDTHYARPVREHLMLSFSQLLLVRVHQRLFQDTNEESVILFAAGAGDSCDEISFVDVPDLAGLQDALADKAAIRRVIHDDPEQEGLELGDLNRAGQELISRILLNPAASFLGDVAKIRIGTVTGANKFFVRTKPETITLGNIQNSVPILARTAWLARPTFDNEQLTNLDEQRYRTRLLTLPHDAELNHSPAMATAIAEAEELRFHLRHHTQRAPWWSAPTYKIAAAFLPYMIDEFKGVVRNDAQVTSTNTIHQIEWKTNSEETAESTILSSWSTLTAVSAELAGRRFGGGLLKLEPSNSKRLIILRSIEQPQSRLADIRSAQEARSLADAAVTRKLGLTSTDHEVLTENLLRLTNRRLLPES